MTQPSPHQCVAKSQQILPSAIFGDTSHTLSTQRVASGEVSGSRRLHDRPRRHHQRSGRPVRPGHLRRAQAEQAAGEHHHLPGQKIKLTGSASTPAATPAAPATSASSSVSCLLARAGVYVVKAGDTLGAIAARHGVGLSEVFAWNGLNMGSIIYPGQKVKVGGSSSTPAPSAPAATTTAPATASTSTKSGSYTIKAGDTLSGIAARNDAARPRTAPTGAELMSSNINDPGRSSPFPARRRSRRRRASLLPPRRSCPARSRVQLPGSCGQLGQPEQGPTQRVPGPQPRTDEVNRGGHGTAHGRGRQPGLGFCAPGIRLQPARSVPGQRDQPPQVIPSSGEWASDLVGRKLNLLDPYDNATVVSRSSASWSARARTWTAPLPRLPGPVLGQPERHV